MQTESNSERVVSIVYDCERWVVGDVLSRQAEKFDDKTWIQVVGGGELSFGGAHRIGNQVARALRQEGITAGDMVGVMLPNGLDYCYTWFGISRLGAIHVAINTDYKGEFLAHVLVNSGATHLVLHHSYLDRVEQIQPSIPDLTHVIVVGFCSESGISERRFQLTRFESYKEFSSENLNIQVSHRDSACVMYTSGTTGPSKGVVMPHAHIYLFGLGTIENMGLTESDKFYIVLPLFHANALFMQLYASLIAGAGVVLREKFSAGNWIRDIAEHEATITNSLGVIVAFALKQQPSAWDTRHKLRAIGVAPNLPELDHQLRTRFNIPEVHGLYGMTEINIPLYTRAGDNKPGSCGRLWERYYELQIVDPDTDLPVASGTTGEIVVRPRLPFGFMSGYLNMPEKTIEAWRNFWFHTGDAATMDEDGYVYFVDRIKDCIRRRGENISSAQIEQVIASHPNVTEVAAVAVDSEIAGAEEEIKTVLVVRGEFDAHEFLKYCEQHLPRFAVPRYIELVEALPKTPTGKIRKNELRLQGVNKATVDITSRLV